MSWDPDSWPPDSASSRALKIPVSPLSWRPLAEVEASSVRVVLDVQTVSLTKAEELEEDVRQRLGQDTEHDLLWVDKVGDDGTGIAGVQKTRDGFKL